MDWNTPAMIDSVLVACPTYSGLSDSLDAYLSAYNAFTWPNRDLLIVDNTRDGGVYAESIRRKGVNALHIEPTKKFQETFGLCWQLIAKHANDHLYRWVLSIEQDVICPPKTIDLMLDIAVFLAAPFVTHTYPYHFGVRGLYQGLGCTLISRNLLNIAIEVDKEDKIFEGSVYKVAKSQTHASLAGMLDIKHLDGANRYWQYDDESLNDPRLHYPVEYDGIQAPVRRQ